MLSFVFVLGVLVFVHELGHFLAAKRVGIRVLKFQLGFNPTILSFRFGETEYGIGALPLGGYVKMAGEANEDGPTGDPREFLSKTRWQRFQVLFMGPAMNLLLAFVLLAGILYQGAEVASYADQPVNVGLVKPESPAALADIRPGDRIVSVAGHRVDTWEEFSVTVGTRPNREIAIGLLRDGLDVTKTVTPAALADIRPGDRIISVAGHRVDTWEAFSVTVGTRPNREISIGLLRDGLDVTKTVTPVAEERGRFETGDIGVMPNVHPHLAAISENEPGAKAGLKAGDVIVAANGMPMTFDTEFRQVIRKNANTPLTLSILRAGSPMTIIVTPRMNGKVGYLGVTPVDDTKTIKPSILGAFRLSWEKNWSMTQMIGQTIWGLLTRELSPKQLMGPIAIAQVSGESAQLGWMALLGLMVTLSLNLGLLNLMPIPMLDGGHIMIMALEGLARRDFSVKVKEKFLLAGFVVLMMLMVTVFYNDLSRIGVFDRLLPKATSSQPATK
ncbi:MAG TPA: RIP metalloprotease RseP [Vicinamibacterales bacterium]|nr:RIP metalloprotease RseP [Vicinamibacterales bacterium]